VFFNSGDGIDEQDVFPVAVGGHAHQNWAFTAPGVYKVDVQASGTLVGASEAIQSEVATFTFYLDAASGSLTITHATDGQATLSWYASPGVTYQLESKNSLLGGNWLSEGEPVMGTAALIERPVTFTGQGFSKFFRVRQIHTNAD
jgi:surface-anchored protein